MTYAMRILFIYEEIFCNLSKWNRKDLATRLSCSDKTITNCINAVNEYIYEFVDRTAAIEYDFKLNMYIITK